MALSNIFNEPRREIIETLVGIVIVSLAVILDWYLSTLLRDLAIRRGIDDVPSVFWIMVLGGSLIFCALAVLIVILLVTHKIGEVVCNYLQDRGINL